MTSLMPILSVAAGGAIGAAMRYGVLVWAGLVTKFPLPTLMVNVVGCFIAGVIASLLLAKAPESTNLQLLLITGMLGGFTTFSAFSLETLRLVESGQSGLATLNVLANVLGSLLAVFCGWWLTRAVAL